MFQRERNTVRSRRSVADNFAFQYSAKLHNGVDMLNIRADSAEEFFSYLDFSDEEFDQLLDFGSRIRAVEAAKNGLGASAVGGQQQPQQNYQQQPAQNNYQQNQGTPGGGGFQNGQPDPTGQSCALGHGVRVFKAFTSPKSGKSLKVWECPQGDRSCKSVYL
jgi:hypothetical protein